MLALNWKVPGERLTRRRGAGHSAGRTSWTAKPERDDYASVVGFLVHYVHYLDPFRATGHSRNTSKDGEEGQKTPITAVAEAEKRARPGAVEACASAGTKAPEARDGATTAAAGGGAFPSTMPRRGSNGGGRVAGQDEATRAQGGKARERGGDVTGQADTREN